MLARLVPLIAALALAACGGSGGAGCAEADTGAATDTAGTAGTDTAPSDATESDGGASDVLPNEDTDTRDVDAASDAETDAILVDATPDASGDATADAISDADGDVRDDVAADADDTDLVDAPRDATPDAPDAPTDVPPDAEVDAGSDTSTDADTGPDADADLDVGPDTPPDDSGGDEPLEIIAIELVDVTPDDGDEAGCWQLECRVELAGGGRGVTLERTWYLDGEPLDIEVDGAVWTPAADGVAEGDVTCAVTATRGDEVVEETSEDIGLRPRDDATDPDEDGLCTYWDPCPLDRDETTDCTADRICAAVGTLDLRPLTPTTVDDLVATVALDPDDPLRDALVWSWLRDGEPSGADDGPVVPAAETARDEEWQVRVGTLYVTDPCEATVTATIRNSPPRGSIRLLVPEPWIPCNEWYTCETFGRADADGDRITISDPEWFADGERFANGETIRVVLREGQVVTCEVELTDGSLTTTLTSEPAVVGAMPDEDGDGVCDR